MKEIRPGPIWLIPSQTVCLPSRRPTLKIKCLVEFQTQMEQNANEQDNGEKYIYFENSFKCSHQRQRHRSVDF